MLRSQQHSYTLPRMPQTTLSAIRYLWEPSSCAWSLFARRWLTAAGRMARGKVAIGIIGSTVKRILICWGIGILPSDIHYDRVGPYWNTPSNTPHTHFCSSSSKPSLRHAASLLRGCLIVPADQPSSDLSLPCFASSQSATPITSQCTVMNGPKRLPTA